jgi:asparagine synthase (glutamine-hydrolysing)
MCGIVGCVGLPAQRAALEDAVERLRHRGPDDAGIEHPEGDGPAVWLGFRRLSILDLSERGHQPMRDAAGELWIVFNGEIYNFPELRRDLEGRGHRFASRSDTEVLLYAYREWGLDFVSRLDGMFAIALWDARDRSLVLARDRLGKKPLYYHVSPGGLGFASELKALLALPGVERRLDLDAVRKFFTFLWVPEPDTLLRGVRQLEPGTLAVYRDGALSQRRYWDLPAETVTPGSTAQAMEELDARLYAAVRKRLISDVPLGAFLSGGVDSALIVALMRRAGEERILTQTIGYAPDDARYDIASQDAPYARMVRDHLGGLDYHEITPRADVVDLLPKLVWHLDDPVADPAAISTYLMCRAAREHATVMLSGMGAEELFAGYARHRAVMLAERYRRLPARLRTGLLEPLLARVPSARPGPLMAPARHAKKFVRSAGQAFPDSYFGYLSYYTPEESAALVPGAVLDPLGGHRERLPVGGDVVRAMSYLDLRTFLPGLNLRYTDRASMAASVEVRAPFLDTAVVEYVASLPSALKLRGGVRKYILKRVAERYLPRRVVHRPKAGFSAPIRAWVQRDLRPMIGDLLSPDRIRRRGLLDETMVWKTIEEAWSGREDHAFRVWAFMTFELWAETFLDRDGQIALAA